MLSRNMIDYPIEKLSFIDNKEILRQKTDYNTTKDNLILPSAIQSSTTGENGLQPEITFDLYDSRGNILQYTARDGVVVSFVWGYGQQYPVAKIVNATYDEVKEALNRFDNDLSHLQNYTDTQLITELNKLRTKLNKAHVYTYTYKPLVGMVSETDSNGIITEYDYDSFGRLLNVFDKDKNILKQFEYHYKNQ